MANPNTASPDNPESEAQDSDLSPACVMTFNANDPSGVAGLTADIAAMVSADSQRWARIIRDRKIILE